jgi:hypothetical protein
MTRAHTPAPRPHRGMPVRQRLVERDSYGILLVLIVLALLAATLSIGSFGSFLRSVTIGAVLLFALRTSGASRVEIATAGSSSPSRRCCRCRSSTTPRSIAGSRRPRASCSPSR